MKSNFVRIIIISVLMALFWMCYFQARNRPILITNSNTINLAGQAALDRLPSATAVGTLPRKNPQQMTKFQGHEYRDSPGEKGEVITKVHWTSLHGKKEEDSYHFFSAYYDGRKGAKSRPIVIVMGYVFKNVQRVELYCKFKYSNGSTSCLKTPAIESLPKQCFWPILDAKAFHYHCHMSSGEEPPVSIALSTSSDCIPASTSKEIPVRNVNQADVKPAKKFGVCVQSPVVQENRHIFQTLIEYIEMSQLLGAELITFYINRDQLDADILKFILDHYPDTVRVVEWKKFEKWHPLHYFGQLLVISDCLYRSMYEVEYSAVTDIDEMILPVKHYNWSDMMTEIEALGNYSAGTFVFQNAFFKPDDSKPSVLPNCSVSKYFTRTNRFECYPGYSYRTKTITKPKLLLESSVHTMCTHVEGYDQFNVPPEVGILGHYRNPIPNDCVHHKNYRDDVAMKFQDKLTAKMCSTITN